MKIKIKSDILNIFRYIIFNNQHHGISSGGNMSIIQQFVNFISARNDYEHPSFVDFLIVIFFEIIGIGIVVAELTSAITIITQPEIPYLTYIVILLFLLMNVFLVAKVLNFREAIIRREEFIKLVAQNTNPECEAVSMIDKHYVKKNGNNHFSRTIELKRKQGAIGKVFWYEVGLGTTNGINKSIFPKDLIVKRTSDNKRLSRIFFEVRGRKRMYAILINPILEDENDRCKFEIVRRNWTHVWDKLVSCEEDDGNIAIDFPVEHLEYHVILPKNFQFAQNGYKIDPRLNAKIIEPEFDNDQHTLVFEAKNVAVCREGYWYKLKTIHTV